MATTLSLAPRQPAPTSMATFLPELSTSAARLRSASIGTTFGWVQPTPENTAPCFLGGSLYSISCRSLGKISAVTRRSALAMRTARSIRWRTWLGTIA